MVSTFRNKILTLIFVFIIVSTNLFATEQYTPEEISQTSSSSPSTPFSPSISFDVEDSITQSYPDNPKVVRDAFVKDYRGLSVNNDDVHVDSALEIFTANFKFNQLGNSDFKIKDRKIHHARAISDADDNTFTIINPLDTSQNEKLKIFLNKTKEITYDYFESTTNLSVVIPQETSLVLSDGPRNITIEPNGVMSKITIEKSSISKGGKNYDKQRFIIENANLTYRNKNIVEKLITTQNATVRIDMEKGFGWLLLNAKIGLMPGDAYEYYDLRTKEKSYSIYNSGAMPYEYGLLKAGFDYDLLPVLNLGIVNYGFEGSNEVTLHGVIEYRRVQSFSQLKQMLRTYANYLAADLPYLPVYKSEMLGNSYRMSFADSGENYTAAHNYDSSIETMTNKLNAVQNSGYFSVELAAKSPLAYHVFINRQKCPDYAKKTIAVPGTERTTGEMALNDDVLKFANHEIYIQGTREFERLESRLKQMIVSSNPERHLSV